MAELTALASQKDGKNGRARLLMSEFSPRKWSPTIVARFRLLPQHRAQK